MKEVLEHYTAEPFVFNPDRVYEQNPPRDFAKPVGLWVSVAGEDDWPTWCRGENFRLHALEHVAVVRLHENANICRVTNPRELWAFHHRYAIEDADQPDRSWVLDGRRYWGLDWRKVVTDYDGLILAPYLWSQRLDGPMWYYGIDASSGCLWDLSAVANVEVVQK